MKPFYCVRCQAVLGQTDGATLDLGTCLIYRSVLVYCCQCRAKRVWRPVALAQKMRYSDVQASV